MKVFSGDLKPQCGQVEYAGTDVLKSAKRSSLHTGAVMSQQPELHFPLTAEEVVMMGRYPHFNYRHSQKMRISAYRPWKNGCSRPLWEEITLLYRVAKTTGCNLQGFVTDMEAEENLTRYLFLDEAIAHLDLKHQQQLLKSLKNSATTAWVVLRNTPRPEHCARICRTYDPYEIREYCLRVQPAKQ